MRFDISPDGIRALISQGESLGVEFKLRFGTDSLLQHAVAFSNGEGGIILYGIAPDGTIAGVTERDIGWITRRVPSLLSMLRMRWKTGVVEIDGRKVVFVSIEGNPNKEAYPESSAISILRMRRFFVEFTLLMACILCFWYLSDRFSHYGIRLLFFSLPPFEMPIVTWTLLTSLSFLALVFYGTAYEISPLRLISSLIPLKLLVGSWFGFRAKTKDHSADEGGPPTDIELVSEPIEAIPTNNADAIEATATTIEAEIRDREVGRRLEETLTDVLFKDISQRASFFANRMERRTQTYMILGVGMGTLGLGIWYWTFKGVAAQHFTSFGEFAQAAAPRVTILFFIELFAGFFLRQYRIGVEDFKYFFELERRAAWKRIAYSIFASVNPVEALQKFASEITNESSGQKLQAGESTPTLEAMKSEGNVTLDAVKTMAQAIQDVVKSAKSK